MKKLHTLLFALGLSFLVFLIWKTGIRQLWRQLGLLGWGLIPIIIAEGVAEVFHAISWRYCFSGPHRRISFVNLVRIHFAGNAISFLTPTASLAGEVTKAALLAGNRQGPEAVSAVMIGKLSCGLGHLSFVAIGSIILLPVLQLPPALRAPLLLGSATLAAGIVIFLFLQKRGKLGSFVRWLAARNVFGKSLQGFATAMERVDETLEAFHRERPWDLARSVCWHLLGFAVGIFSTWYFLFLLGERHGFMVAARIWVLVLWFDLVTFAVPLNLGVLEGGRVVAFRAFGFGALPGLTFGIVTRLAQLFWAGFGLLNYALLIARTSAAPEERPARATGEATLPLAIEENQT
jgi:hypothetical protein